MAVLIWQFCGQRLKVVRQRLRCCMCVTICDQGKSVPVFGLQGFREDAWCSATEEASNNKELFALWVEKMISRVQYAGSPLPSESDVVRMRPRMRLLFLDNADCHLSPAAWELAATHNIRFISLPKNTTHLTCPVDAGPGRAIQNALLMATLGQSRNVEALDLSFSPERVTVHNFGKFLIDPWNEVMRPDVLTKSFRITGLWPQESARSFLADSAHFDLASTVSPAVNVNAASRALCFLSAEPPNSRIRLPLPAIQLVISSICVGLTEEEKDTEVARLMPAARMSSSSSSSTAPASGPMAKVRQPRLKLEKGVLMNSETNIRIYRELEANKADKDEKKKERQAKKRTDAMKEAATFVSRKRKRKDDRDLGEDVSLVGELTSETTGGGTAQLVKRLRCTCPATHTHTHTSKCYW